MKTIKILLLILFLLSSGTRVVYAGPGSSAASFLRIGVGAKPAAMGDAYVGVSGDILSLYSNPAGLCSLYGNELSFSHAVWVESINYSNATLGIPLLEGYMALGISGLYMDDIDKFSRYGDPVGESYRPSDIAVTAGYSRFIGGVSAGAALKYITSDIDGYRANAVALDIGAMRYFGMLNAGVSVQNIGTKMKFRERGESLPMTVRAGVSYPFFVSGAHILATAEASYSEDIPFRINAGCNAELAIGRTRLSLRMGVKSYAEGLDTLSHFTTGLGVQIGDIVFDYALVPYEDLGLTHRVSVRFLID